MTDTAAEYLTADELVKRWKGRVTVGTLANWRAQRSRRGPSYVKLGRNVLYPMAGVLDWEKKNLHSANDNKTEGE